MNSPGQKRAQSQIGDRDATKRAKRQFRFPGRHQNHVEIYQKDRWYRDNSLFLEKLFNHDSNALVFTRPMQLGKTALLSLADELFSVNKNSDVDMDLSYSPGEEDRNKWFVLRLDFSAVSAGRTDDESETWEDIGRRIDEETAHHIKEKVVGLLAKNRQLRDAFKTVSLNLNIGRAQISRLVCALTSAVELVDGRLLFIVDEYDLPIRDVLLRLMPLHSRNLHDRVKKKIRSTFEVYFSFFRTVKVSLEHLRHAKIFLTGITPVRILEMGGLAAVSVTFDEDMADAVGLREDDVHDMLVHVNKYAPFENGEWNLAFKRIKQQFNNLCFPRGSSLYHTALVNRWMNVLLKENYCHKAFLQDDWMVPYLGREPIPSSVFDVLGTARNLRHVANMIMEGRDVIGYKLSENLSLEDLLQEKIVVDDYLTLLVHLGVASAQGTTVKPTFRITSGFYRRHFFKVLMESLQASLESLTSLTTKEELYTRGEEMVADLVTCASKDRMATQLLSASRAAKNILKFNARDTTPSKTDNTVTETIRIESKTCVVILELRGNPTVSNVIQTHEGLLRCVERQRDIEKEIQKEGRNRPVAGFIVEMYGDAYGTTIVQKLSNYSRSLPG
jgi:hypothetical protein